MVIEVSNQKICDKTLCPPDVRCHSQKLVGAVGKLTHILICINPLSVLLYTIVVTDMFTWSVMKNTKQVYEAFVKPTQRDVKTW